MKIFRNFAQVTDFYVAIDQETRVFRSGSEFFKTKVFILLKLREFLPFGHPEPENQEGIDQECKIEGRSDGVVCVKFSIIDQHDDKPGDRNSCEVDAEDNMETGVRSLFRKFVLQDQTLDNKNDRIHKLP